MSASILKLLVCKLDLTSAEERVDEATESAEETFSKLNDISRQFRFKGVKRVFTSVVANSVVDLGD